MRLMRLVSGLLCAGVLAASGSALAQDTQTRLRALEEAYRAGVISAQEYRSKRAEIEAGARGPTADQQRKLQALEQARRAGVISEPEYQRKRADILGRAEPSFGPGSAYARGGWLLNGQTLGPGNSAFLARFAYPGVALSILHGVADKVDAGGEFQFQYAPLGMPSAAGNILLSIGPVLRFIMVETAKFNLGTRFAPGFALLFAGGTGVGVTLPVDFMAGLTIIPDLSLNFGLSLPMAMNFTGNFVYFLPILPSLGVEYRATEDVILGLESAFGPLIQIGYGTAFAFKTLLAIAYLF